MEDFADDESHGFLRVFPQTSSLTNQISPLLMVHPQFSLVKRLPQKKHNSTMWRFPEMGIPLNHPCFQRIFHLGNPWKPSILWYLHLWKSSFSISIFDYQRLGRHAPTSFTLASCDVSSATAAFAWWGGWNDVVHQKYPKITIDKKHI